MILPPQIVFTSFHQEREISGILLGMKHTSNSNSLIPVKTTDLPRSMLTYFLLVICLLPNDSMAQNSSKSSHLLPDAPVSLPSPLEEKVYWQNMALNLLHGETENNTESDQTLAEKLEVALENAKITEWFF